MREPSVRLMEQLSLREMDEHSDSGGKPQSNKGFLRFFSIFLVFVMPLCLSVYLAIYVSGATETVHTYACMYLHMYPSICQFSISIVCLSVYLSVDPYVCLSISISTYLTTYLLAFYFSIYLIAFPSIYMSVFSSIYLYYIELSLNL